MTILYARGKDMKWNLSRIKFLYPPDNFVGSFANEKMQARHQELQDEKINTILKDLAAAKTPAAALQVLNNLDHVQFLLNNIKEFREHKCLEETVLKLYRRDNNAFASGGKHDIWHNLFLECNAQRFYRLGAAFPDEKTPAYRGSVAGVKKGFCWTINRKKVDWFLERWRDKEQGGGTIFSTIISRRDLLIYLKDKEMEELIVSPQFLETAKIETVNE